MLTMLGSEVVALRPGRVIPLVKIGFAERVKANRGVYSNKLSVLLASGALARSESTKVVAVQWGLIAG